MLQHETICSLSEGRKLALVGYLTSYCIVYRHLFKKYIYISSTDLEKEEVSPQTCAARRCGHWETRMKSQRSSFSSLPVNAASVFMEGNLRVISCLCLWMIRCSSNWKRCSTPTQEERCEGMCAAV